MAVIPWFCSEMDRDRIILEAHKPVSLSYAGINKEIPCVKQTRWKVRTDPQGCHCAQSTQNGFRLKWKDLRSRLIKVLEESVNNFSAMYYMIKILNMETTWNIHLCALQTKLFPS